MTWRHPILISVIGGLLLLVNPLKRGVGELLLKLFQYLLSSYSFVFHPSVSFAIDCSVLPCNCHHLYHFYCLYLFLFLHLTATVAVMKTLYFLKTWSALNHDNVLSPPCNSLVKFTMLSLKLLTLQILSTKQTQTNGWVDGRTDRREDRPQTDGWVDGRTDRRVNRPQTDKWVDGKTDRREDRPQTD